MYLNSCTKNLSQLHIAVLLTLSVSVISIFTALFYQYILGYVPCYLCSLARIPYLVLIPLSIISICRKLGTKYIVMMLLTLFIGAIISIYHMMIERGIIQPTTQCKNAIDTNIPTENLIDSIQQSKVTGDCSIPAVKIFGITMTEYNIVINVFLIIFLIFTYLNNKRNI